MSEAIDWAGTAHAAAGHEPRIASLVPSITELLFALDLGRFVVARTGFCVHPFQAVRRVPKIGGTKDPNLAALAKLAPTHLVVNVDENRREVVDAARAFVPHVVVTDPCAPEDNVRLYTLVGALFDRDAPARALAERFTRALAELRASVATLPVERVLYLIWKKPWMTVAPGTYIAATLAEAGWQVVAPPGEARYPVVPDDDEAWTRAQRILLASEPYAFVARHAEPLAGERRRPVHLIDAEMTSWYGSRAIAGMGYLAAMRRSLAA
jgi:ABC-type Fe3+-hydroxamate transport system substrate-binding protein